MATVNLKSLRKVVIPALSFALLGIAGSSSAFGPQSSSFATEHGFDFAETFDGLADWNQSALEAVGNQWDSTELTRMPKLANGSTSAWGYFSLWGHDGASPHSWIGSTEGGARQVWRGEKSASIDLGRTGKGPSRLGLYMGNGYSNFSYFYMVWMPRNTFPTSCSPAGCTGGTPVGTYTEGEPWAYWASYKFNTFSMGCLSSRCPVSETYGPHTSLLMLKPRSYAPTGLSFLQFNGYDHIETYATAGGSIMDSMLGQWFGIEMNLNNISESQTIMNIWVYDQSGNSTQIMVDRLNSIDPDAQGMKWDHFFFGGNNSGSWAWGPTMSSHYYVDDFIIDAGNKGRIGPRYFKAIGVQSTALPSPPPTFSGTPSIR